MPKQLQPKILVIEDDDSISTVIKYNLQKSGYNVQIVKNGDEGLSAAASFKPDLILLDWMLPNKSGIDICTELRLQEDFTSLPIIMISAKGEDFEKVIGLECGADDYMAKPFSSIELLARVKAILRRSRPAFSDKILKFYDIEMDISQHTVIRNNEEVKLSPIEFQILQILLEKNSRVVSREALMDQIWGVEIYVGDRTIDVHITRLRKALLKASNDNFDVIKTVRLAGYKLQAP